MVAAGLQTFPVQLAGIPPARRLPTCSEVAERTAGICRAARSRGCRDPNGTGIAAVTSLQNDIIPWKNNTDGGS